MSDNQLNNENAAKKLATLVYVLQAASFVLPLTLIAAVIINYVKRDAVSGTLAQSHFEWQIRTFWVVLAMTVLAIITSVVFIGVIVLVAVAVWAIYRIVKGWLNLNDDRPMLS